MSLTGLALGMSHVTLGAMHVKHTCAQEWHITRKHTLKFSTLQDPAQIWLTCKDWEDFLQSDRMMSGMSQVGGQQCTWESRRG